MIEYIPYYIGLNLILSIMCLRLIPVKADTSLIEKILAATLSLLFLAPLTLLIMVRNAFKT